jgi:hypothetical protein
MKNIRRMEIPINKNEKERAADDRHLRLHRQKWL